MKNSIVITSKNYLDILNKKLAPYRTQQSFDGKTLIEFWRVSQVEGQTYKNTPRSHDCEKELAMLSISREKDRFTLHYYPLNKEIQVIDNLPIDRLQEAINLLSDAGF